MKIKIFKTDKSIFSKKSPSEKRQILLIIFGLSLLISILSMPFHFLFLYNIPKPGSKAENNIISLKSYRILDSKNYEKKKENALRSVPLVFDFDEENAKSQKEILDEAFLEIREWILTHPYEKFYSNEEVLRDGLSILEKKLNTTNIPLESFKYLWSLGFSEKYETLIQDAFSMVLSIGYIEKREPIDIKRKAVKRILPDFEEYALEHPNFIMGKSSLNAYLTEFFNKNVDLKTSKYLTEFVSAIVKPNVFLNFAEIEKRERETLKKISPSYYVVFKGEILLRKGETILPAIYEKITGIYNEELKKTSFIYFISNLILYFLLTLGVYVVGTASIKKFASDVKSLIFAVTLVSINLIIVYIFHIIGIFISFNYLIYPLLIIYFVPFSFTGMLLRLFLNSETAIIFVTYILMILLNFFSENQYLAMYSFILGIAGAYFIGQFSTRGEILKSGLKIAILGLIFLYLFLGIFINDDMWKEHLLLLNIAVITSNVLASILVLILTPILEYIFKYTTNLKLLELSNQDHPLLKELMLKAPGTYNHSILIGNLVESAARAIKVNPLLARVSAYYHDIGKIKMPEMFIENQLSGYNKHEELSPYMSALIVASHVKEGIELAKQYNLGQPIIDAIAQHHGTRLMTFFYAKALKQDPNVKEENFRYPGPKPKSREIALLMMADAVEAAARVLEDFTPSRIGSLVKKITQDIFLDGQLDECELTLKDLNLVVDSFTRSLIAIYHQRVDYPDLKAVKENGHSKKSN